MSNLTVENVYTRQTAKQLTRQHFWKLLGMTAIVVAVVYAVMMGGSFLLSLTGSEGVVAVGGFVLVLATLLLASGLGLGLTAATLEICRGGQVTVGAVFGRMGQCLKAVGLSLWIGLKTVLWALPGYATIFAAAFVVAGSATTSSGAMSESAAVIMTLLPVLGLILVFALVIPAAYRYMLATYILADKPDVGVFECVRQSKAMMKGHKWQAFKLMVPIMLVMYAVTFGVALLLGIVTGILGESSAAVVVAAISVVVTLFLSLYYSIRLTLAYSVFYLKRAGQPAAEETPAEEAPLAE